MKITESQFDDVLDTYQRSSLAPVSPEGMRNALKTINVKVAPNSEMITINGVNVPAPERTEPDEGTNYHIIDPSQQGSFDTWTWHNDESDKEWLQRGLVYLEEKDAKAVIEAMMKPLTEYMEKKHEHP